MMAVVETDFTGLSSRVRLLRRMKKREHDRMNQHFEPWFTQRLMVFLLSLTKKELWWRNCTESERGEGKNLEWT